ncbi:dihydrofolate reductase family protein [Myxococcus sp. Y35]|uniref:dihydrofolate reductase family protein n=1 Tax=Pseudomyxococcus flavus TaxID=3115648 RepID=UPI003CF57DF8
MGRPVYSNLTLLDGFICDERRNFDWAVPDEDVHAFVNKRMRGILTHVYGRRMYETLRAWQDFDLAVMVDFAHLWRGAVKVVVSRTLETPTTPRTKL